MIGSFSQNLVAGLPKEPHQLCQRAMFAVFIGLFKTPSYRKRQFSVEMRRLLPAFRYFCRVKQGGQRTFSLRTWLA
jgi:hypothetical protein